MIPSVMAKKPRKPKPARRANGREPIPTPEQIKAARGTLTQAEAAKKVHVNQGVWSAWEAGARTPSRQSAYLIRLLRENRLPD
jgi:DNA-binding transcriptional regulator YiaG